MTCGYICPVCEGSGRLEDGSPCDNCQPKPEERFRAFLFILPLLLHSLQLRAQYTALVNPMIGTGGHGHTFPGAVLPFGMVSVSPDTRIDGSWDGCSGYHYNDSFIYGFSHTHLSGTGCSDLGDIAWLPVYVDSLGDLTGTLRSKFDKKSEAVQPGYYKVKLNSGIQVELTASLRSGFQLYTFPRTGKVAVILNLNHRDALLSHQAKVLDNHAVSGYRASKAWAGNQLVYFYSQFSKKPLEVKELNGSKTIVYIFEVKVGEQILLSTGISPVDEVGARNNLSVETHRGSLGFKEIREQADFIWNQRLSCIQVDELTEGKALPQSQEKYINLYSTLSLFYTSFFIP